MSSDGVDAESKVSGNQANIPVAIRRKLNIDDGDQLRWTLENDERVRVEVVTEQTGTFDDFEGYDGDEDTNVVEEHDGWGIE